MTLGYLRDMYFSKYGSCLLINSKRLNMIPEVVVVMTNDQYKELNEDIARLTQDIMMIVDDDAEKKDETSHLLYTKIILPHVCEFIVEIGEELQMRLLDPAQEHGEEEL